jgi:hypothetical protein
MRDIADAIRAGERNRDTMVLVRNYCANARVEKFGGTGMIEQYTGLPIGHHSMRCDFAPEVGIASWDLRDAVIDFYDRNCATCTHRKPLRLPNLLEIVTDRDRKRAVHEAQAEAKAAIAANALGERNAIRADLLPRLSAVGRTLLEDIAAFDADRSSENFERVTQSARLAPEHFTPDLVQYVSLLATGHPWFAEAALIILDAVGADDGKIIDLAVAVLRSGRPVSVAVERLLLRLEAMSADSVPEILGSAIDLADPGDRELFYGDDKLRRPRDPSFLEALFRRFPGEVITVIEQMLLSGRRLLLERAGRGLHALQARDLNAANPILRTLLSVYVRAPSLVGDLKDHGDRLPDLAKAVNNSFDANPQQVDTLLQSLHECAPASYRARVMKVYSLAAHVGNGKPPVPASSVRHSIALTRLVWAATVERDDKVLEEVASAFRPRSNGLEKVVRAQLDAFIGALFLLDDRLTELDAAMKEPAENGLVAIERDNRRAAMRGLMKRFVEWASEAAAGDDPSVAKIIGMFDTIPEGRDNLRGALLGATKVLSRDLAGLKRLLPHLYAALVGASVLGRFYAATAVGELPHRSRANIPDLLFEAFGLLLSDRYVLVHKTAVDAFRHSIIPEPHQINAGQAILNLIRYYKLQSNEDHFLAECVRILAGMVDTFGKASGELRRYLIEVAMGIDPVFLQSEIQSLSYSLGSEPEFAKLAALMIPHLVDRHNKSDKALNLLREVTVVGLKAHTQAFHDAAIAVLDTDLQTALGVVEAFLRADMLREAHDLVTALVNANGDTVRLRRRRTLLRWPQLALQFEAAVAMRDLDAIAIASHEWAEAAAADAQDEEDGRERRARSNLPF